MAVNHHNPELLQAPDGRHGTGLAAELLGCFADVLHAYRGKIPPRFLPAPETLGGERELAPGALPALRFLPRVAEIVTPAAAPLAALLAAAAARFQWGRTYRLEDFGAAFLDNYGWLEVFGARGHFAHHEIAGGLLLLGPDTFYPEHRHVAEEIYLPLTGAAELWMEGQHFKLRTAGEVVHHPSNVAHAMRTGADPLLALYLWRGGPLDQRSEIVAQPKSQPRRG